MVVEKLRSPLKFGRFSTRYKDIFDIYYHCDKIKTEKILVCMDSFVFNDSEMRENNMADVHRRISRIFQDKIYKNTVDKSDKRWLDDDIDMIFDRILGFIESMK